MVVGSVLGGQEGLGRSLISVTDGGGVTGVTKGNKSQNEREQLKEGVLCFFVFIFNLKLKKKI